MLQQLPDFLAIVQDNVCYSMSMSTTIKIINDGTQQFKKLVKLSMMDKMQMFFLLINTFCDQILEN